MMEVHSMFTQEQIDAIVERRRQMIAVEKCGEELSEKIQRLRAIIRRQMATQEPIDEKD